MNIVKELFKQQKEVNYPKIPEKLSDDELDIPHILFFSPKVNAAGYYRMLLPYLKLAQSKKFKTHIIGLDKQDFNTPFGLTKTPLPDEWILWADYLIFPLVTVDIKYISKACKIINPELQIVMDIDISLHTLHPDDPLLPKISKEMIKICEENLNIVDIITSYNEHILNFYQELLEDHYQNDHTIFAHIPNLLPITTFEELPKIATKSDPIRIGLLTDHRSINDVLLLKNVLLEIQVKLKQKVVFVLFGWNGVLANGSKPLQDVTIEYHKPVDFMKYFQKLHELQLDIALLPMRDKANHCFASDTKCLELLTKGVPVIASKCLVYSKYILQGRTGILVQDEEEWKEAIVHLIHDKSLRNKLGVAAKKHVWSNYSYTIENTKMFQELFL